MMGFPSWREDILVKGLLILLLDLVHGFDVFHVFQTKQYSSRQYTSVIWYVSVRTSSYNAWFCFPSYVQLKALPTMRTAFFFSLWEVAQSDARRVYAASGRSALALLNVVWVEQQLSKISPWLLSGGFTLLFGTSASMNSCSQRLESFGDRDFGTFWVHNAITPKLQLKLKSWRLQVQTSNALHLPRLL